MIPKYIREPVVAFVGTDDKNAHYMKTPTKTWCGIEATDKKVHPVDNQDWKPDCEACRTNRGQAMIAKVNAS